MKPKIREVVVARTYALIKDSVVHDLTADSAAVLATQLAPMTGGVRAGQLARLAWGDDQTDVTLGGIRLLATGRLVRQSWAELPTFRSKPPPPLPPVTPQRVEAEVGLFGLDASES